MKVNCGQYGTCVVRNRQASCRCEPGYENNGQLTCIGMVCHILFGYEILKKYIITEVILILWNLAIYLIKISESR